MLICDLIPMHVKPAYDRHRDLLELLQLLTDALIII